MSVKGATALGTEPIGKLLRQYAVPAIVAMTASSLYNMVDSIFIGQGVGPLAISGLAVTFPLMNISTAFGAFVGVGCATLLSVKLGQKDYNTAFKVLGNCLTMNIILGVVLMAVALLYLDPILYFFGASDSTIGYARDYMEIILLGNVITHLYFGLNAMLRSSGHPKLAMYATIATVMVNTILDPIFIYWFDWGIRGAAIATVVSQMLSLIWQLKVFSDKKELIHFRRGSFKLNKRIMKDTMSIGMSPFFMNMASCLVVLLINQGLLQYGGDLAIGAYGIVNRLVFVMVMIVMGFNQAMQPIAGYNYGANQMDRVKHVLKLTVGAATIVTTTGFVVFVAFSESVVSLFTTDAELIGLSSKGLRTVCAVFPIVGMQMVVSNYFQSIGKPVKAIILSLSRQVLMLIPLLIIMPKFFGVAGVWWSMPVSDALSTILALVMITREMKSYKVAAAA
jgi:putative MATE family efflux protein